MLTLDGTQDRFHRATIGTVPRNVEMSNNFVLSLILLQLMSFLEDSHAT
jgi:hypothetical protein